MTTLPPLSEQDREALRNSVRNLDDIPSDTQARISAGFARAHRVANEIREGRRDPLR